MDSPSVDVPADGGRIFRVIRQEWKGRDVVNIRLCYPHGPDFYRYTKIGLVMSPEQAEALRQALGEVLARAPMCEEGARRA